jgi:hypothetical protein
MCGFFEIFTVALFKKKNKGTIMNDATWQSEGLGSVRASRIHTAKILIK